MKRFFPTYLCLTLLLVLLCSASSWAAVSGEIEYSYTNYLRENKDAEDFEGTSFTQRYSAMYEKQGLLAGGRSGFYDYGVGAAWAAFNTDFDTGQESGDIKKDDFKLLYSGRVQVAPGALPFRLDAFSYDLGLPRFQEDDQRALGGLNYVRPLLATDLQSGQTIVTGVQLQAGIRNGSYLGAYREILSKFPRLLLDYRQVDHDDTDAFSPSKFRSRNLAFVSLNKKDNWFHYRVYEYKDYINDNRDRNDRTIILGTVDHTLKRQWVNLTNWIKISVDGNYTVFDDEASAYKDHNLFDVNLYSIMSRRDLSVSTFANLQREQQGGTISKRLEIPLYVSKVISPKGSMRANFLVDSLQEIRDSGDFSEDDDVYHGRVRYETFRNRNVRIDPSVEIENHVGDRGDGRAVRGMVEASSNQRYNPRGTWKGGLSLAFFDGTGSNELDTDLWEVDLHGGVDAYINPLTTYGVSQQLLLADGSYGDSTTRLLVPSSAQGISKRRGEGSVVGTDILRSLTNLYFEHTTSYRMQNRFELFLKYESQDNFQNVEFRHRLDYTYRHLSVRISNSLSIGDDDKNGGFNTVYLRNLQSVNAPDKQFLHISKFNYQPNKFWRGYAQAEADWRQNDDGDSIIMTRLTQEFTRNFYTANGRVRKIADFSQRFHYERSKNENEHSSGGRFQLRGSYYPNHVLSFYSQAFYNFYDYRNDTFGYDFETKLNFPKVQLAFNYQFATDEDGNYKDHRYEVSARKTF